MINQEIIIINDIPFYRIQNGTSYDYAPIPKQFKPYFERLQQENQSLKEQQKEFIKFLEEKEKMFDIAGDPRCAGVCHGALSRYKKIIGLSEVE